jgi:type VI secretion system protein ImpE
VHAPAAEQAIRDGDLATALSRLQEQVRRAPDQAPLRTFLFQLLAVQGEWERAGTQLSLAAELDASALAMAQMYREAILCERLRAEVFAGKRSPLIFGEPSEWLALLIEALLVTGTPRAGEASALRARAFELAPTTPGTLDGQPFEWIADADMRLGPVIEAVVNGKYYWVPFARLARIDFEAPTDLRDVVWTPAHFQFTNGGEVVGVVPTRYPGSERADDPQLRLARRTEWIEGPPDVFTGLGQRVFATDAGEHSLMDIRSIVLQQADADAPSNGDSPAEASDG